MPTVAEVEYRSLLRLSGAFGLVGMDFTTVDGTNPDLVDPIQQALMSMGISSADPLSVADADVLGLSSTEFFELLDRIEYRGLLTVWTRYTGVDMRMGMDDQKLSQYADRLQKRLERLALIYGDVFGAYQGGAVIKSLVCGGVRNDQTIGSPHGWPVP